MKEKKSGQLALLKGQWVNMEAITLTWGDHFGGSLGLKLILIYCLGENFKGGSSAQPPVFAIQWTS